MLIVSDTSPISDLILIGRLSLLRDMYQVVIVPPKVHAEVLELEYFGEDISAYTTADWFEIKAPEDVALVQQLLEKLDEGEAEAIALAKELSADFLLIDERRGLEDSRRNGYFLHWTYRNTIESKASWATHIRHVSGGRTQKQSGVLDKG